MGRDFSYQFVYGAMHGIRGFRLGVCPRERGRRPRHARTWRPVRSSPGAALATMASSFRERLIVGAHIEEIARVLHGLRRGRGGRRAVMSSSPAWRYWCVYSSVKVAAVRSTPAPTEARDA